jgi:hypothetical protein
MRIKNVLMILLIWTISLIVISCGDDTPTDPDDNNNTDTTKTDSIVIPQKVVTGTLKIYQLDGSSTPWDKGICEISARVYNYPVPLATGTVNADGSFTLTFKKTIATTVFSKLVSDEGVFWGNGVQYTPSTLKRSADDIKFMVYPTINGKQTAVEVLCQVMSNIVLIEKWMPIIYNSDGSIKGTDALGFVYDCTFTKGFNFRGYLVDTPKGKLTTITSANLPNNVLWIPQFN